MEPTGGNAGDEKRRLREDIEKALAEYGEYSTEEVDEVIKILEKIGMKATKGFTVIKRSDLLEKDMPAVVAGILMKAFGETRNTGEKESGYHAGREKWNTGEKESSYHAGWEKWNSGEKGTGYQHGWNKWNTGEEETSHQGGRKKGDIDFDEYIHWARFTVEVLERFVSAFENRPKRRTK